MNNPTPSNNFRILVVDDNPSIHEDFRKILCPEQCQSGASVTSLVEEVFGTIAPRRAERRFEMDSAFQGREALAAVQAAEQKGRPYSLAFMDVRMPPGWDGIETITRIWKEHPQVQVVICTAYSDYSWDQILETLGETDSLVILKKPFDNVEVLQLAHTLTKKWVMTREAKAHVADLDVRVHQRTQELVEANQQLQTEIQRRSVVESALRQSEERFHRAFETVAVPLTILPLDGGGYLDVNERFVELCGYTKKEVLGKTPEELRLFLDQEFHTQLLKQIQNGKKVRNLEAAIRSKGGQVRQTLVSLEVLNLGARSCLLAAIQDVTEERNLESQLRQSQKMEAIGLLAAGVAHDFNNLLTIIHGYSSLQLAKNSLESDVAKAFTQVRMASERAAALTRQLLAFSRQQIVQRKPVDLGTAISRIRSMLSRSLGETIELECALAPNLPCVNADESNLDQILMNLAVNARDAMPNGGKLLLSTGLQEVTKAQIVSHPDKHAGTFAVLTITDTGCGMDQQTLERIFEPFFTTKPIGRGTGLGLSTVYGIVKQHQGWIEVESQPSRGTTFRIFLPTIQEESHKQPAELEPCRQGALEMAADDVILVVEDEPSVREFVTSMLVEKGYQVVQASSGAEALTKWPGIQGKVRLLLTDMVMPNGVNGGVLARQLLRDQPKLKVLYTSGYSPEVVVNSHPLTEGLNFLSKPFTRERLLAAVEKALACSVTRPELAFA